MPTEGVQLQDAQLFSTPGDVSSFFVKSESYWNARNIRIQRFRQLVKQIDQQQRQHGKTGKYHSFEGNESSSFYAAMVQLLTKNPLRSRIPLEQMSEEGRNQAGQVERLIEGTYRDVDFRRFKRMEADPLHTTLVKFCLSDGWGAAEVVKLSKKDSFIDVRTHDITDVAPEWTSDGLIAVVFRSHRTKTQVALEYPHVDMSGFKAQPRVGFASDTKEPNVPVYTCYWRVLLKPGKYAVWYGVAIGDDWAIKPYVLDWTEEIPAVVSPMNGLPFRKNNDYTEPSDIAEAVRNEEPIEDITDDWTADVGRGIFHMNEKLYPEFNKLWSAVLDFVDSEGHSTYWKETQEGEDSELVIGKGKDAVNALAKDEKIGRIPPGTMAQELNLALSQMASAMQRGGISWQLMGQLPTQEFSGFAINQLLSAALTIATPYINGLTSMYQQVNSFVIEAYKKSRQDFQEVNVWREKTFVQEKIDLSILKNKKFWFDVQIKPGLPNDLAQRVNVAALAKRDRLVDQWTILDEILEVDDPQLIQARLDEEEILQRPTIKLRRLILQMLKEGNRDSAIALLMELRLVESQMQLSQDQLDVQLQQFEQAANMGASTSPITGAGGQGPGGAAPEASPLLNAAGGGGLPPEVSPPELGGVSPAAIRSILGAFAPAMSRGPQYG